MTDVKKESPELVTYWGMGDYDQAPLLNFAVTLEYFVDTREAYNALKGLMQWIACHVQPASLDAPMVMLRGPIAVMYEVMVLHGNYEDFCRRYLRAEIIRHDIDNAEFNKLIDTNAVLLMRERIEAAYEKELVEELEIWIHDRRQPPQILFYTSVMKLLTEPPMEAVEESRCS